jgi:hypothetical protein
MRPRRLLIVFVVAALAGVSVFLAMAWNATTIDDAPADAATARFGDVRRAFGDDESLLVRQADWSVVRRATPPPRRTGDIEHLFVMAYDASEQRLVEVDVPFWFFKLKAPAAQFLVRGTGLDLNELGITGAELEAQGSCIVLDESTADGSRLLVWTE